MESIGQKLKTAREEKSLSLDQVARDTHIAKRFIAAIEEENFDLFPGDTYILGFVRNYADYLGLDAAEIITRYKNLKIQEQPVPIEELLERRTPKTLVIGIAAGAILLLALGAFFLFRGRSGSPQTEKTAEAAPGTYQYEGEVIERPFMQGDAVVVNREGKTYTIRVDRVASNVILAGPVEKATLKEGQEAFIELTPRGETLKVFFRSLVRGEKPPKAILHFDKIIQSPSADIPVTAVPSAGAAPLPSGSPAESSRMPGSQVVLEAPSRGPFTLEVDFRGYCLFRYVTDNQNREERYFRQGETFRTDVRSEIRLWYSNGGALRARISGKEIEFGKPGEVGAARLTWVQAGPGGIYRLEFVPMY